MESVSLLSSDVLVNIGDKNGQRGCIACPRNYVSGIVKIKGRVLGRSIFVWAQSPGPRENEEGRELCGPSGKLWWRELEKVGIQREDCDIQNMVRCWPADKAHGQWVMRSPTKEEVQSCSVYTEQAILQSKAKVHLVLGKVAADAMFGKSKSRPRTFWSEKLRGQVFLLDHPSYFLRGASGERLEAFRKMLRDVKHYLKGPTGRFGFLKTVDYRGVFTVRHAEQVANIIQKECAKGHRLVVDIEDGKLADGTRVLLVVGFSIKPGWARVFVIDHPKGSLGPGVRDGIWAVAKSLLEDKNLQKAMHHGDYDDTTTRKLTGVPIRGYFFDTNYSQYFAEPGERSYSLASIALRKYPEFANYKELVMPEAAPGMRYEDAYKQGFLDFAKVPLKKIISYNGADCDLCKRIELDTGNVSLPLLRVYVDVAYVLSAMEKNGPLFDPKQAEALEAIYPARVSALAQKLKVIARDPDFNPSSPDQVKDLLFDRLGLAYEGDGKPNTRKTTLELLAMQHPVPKLVLDYRAAAKLLSTYVVGFRRSAEVHGGRLRTIWWLTGTGTGRLSSGGGKGKSREEGLVNLQNIHKDPQVKNMLVSDPNWREVVKAWIQGGKNWIQVLLGLRIFLMYDYSQMEIRFLAQSSGDPNLIALLQQGGDIHCMVGHEITGWSVQKIAEDEKTRVFIKGLHFGLVYGLKGPGMVQFLKAKGVKASLGQVNEFLGKYFKKYKRVLDFINHQHQFCEQHGYVENLFGFRMPIEVNDGNEGGSYWANMAVNYPIQGGAHQMLLMAMSLLRRKQALYKPLGIPHMEVHDALVPSTVLEALPETYKLGKHMLEEGVLDIVVRGDFKIDWQVPLKAEAKVGFRYGVPVSYDGGPLEEVVARWCEKNRTVEAKLAKEIAAVAKEPPPSNIKFDRDSHYHRQLRLL